jgi:hypothetical protein
MVTNKTEAFLWATPPGMENPSKEKRSTSPKKDEITITITDGAVIASPTKGIKSTK